LAVLRKVSVAGALALVAGLAVTGCAPVKMGAAAITGNQRVTIATLDTETSMLASVAKSYPTQVQLSQQQITQETLSWLIRFKIEDELASQAGLTVTTADAQKALASTLANAQSQSGQSVTLELLMVANGLAPNLAGQLGRYVAIENKFAEAANGGKLPTTTAEQTAVSSKLSHAQCLAAKSLNIKVNPQFGRMDYSKYAVVAVSDTVSRPAGTAQTASQSGLAPAC
jgi:hypothetical protein